VLIEESALGWKEYELEVMRDLADNCIIVCSIENFDPWACTRRFHHVAPAQTLDRPRIPDMPDGALRCLRGNRRRYGRLHVQVAINPKNGRMGLSR